MDNELIIEKIDFNKLNYVNIYLSIFFFCLFILFVITVISVVNHRINKHFFSPDIISSTTHSNDETILSHMMKLIEDIVNSEKQHTEDRLEKDIQNNTNMKQNIKNLMNMLNEKKQSKLDENTKTYKEMNKYIEKVNYSVSEINDAYLANINAMNNFYDIFKSKMKNYLTQFSGIMNTIQYQIDVAYVTPSLTKAIDPMKKVYNSIYNLFMDNTDFIKTYIKDFNFSNIQPLDTKFKTSEKLFANFNNTNSVLE